MPRRNAFIELSLDGIEFICAQGAVVFARNAYWMDLLKRGETGGAVRCRRFRISIVSIRLLDHAHFTVVLLGTGMNRDTQRGNAVQSGFLRDKLALRMSIVE